MPFPGTLSLHPTVLLLSPRDIPTTTSSNSTTLQHLRTYLRHLPIPIPPHQLHPGSPELTLLAHKLHTIHTHLPLSTITLINQLHATLHRPWETQLEIYTSWAAQLIETGTPAFDAIHANSVNDAEVPGLFRLTIDTWRFIHSLGSWLAPEYYAGWGVGGILGDGEDGVFDLVIGDLEGLEWEYYIAGEGCLAEGEEEKDDVMNMRVTEFGDGGYIVDYPVDNKDETRRLMRRWKWDTLMDEILRGVWRSEGVEGMMIVRDAIEMFEKAGSEWRVEERGEGESEFDEEEENEEDGGIGEKLKMMGFEEGNSGSDTLFGSVEQEEWDDDEWETCFGGDDDDDEEEEEAEDLGFWEREGGYDGDDESEKKKSCLETWTREPVVEIRDCGLDFSVPVIQVC